MPTSSRWRATSPGPSGPAARPRTRCSIAGTAAGKTSCGHESPRATAARCCYHRPAMTLTELKYIVAVARERHFGRAAEACFVSQPTLSVAIKKLEEELGVVLFERGGAEVSVTDVGLRVIAQAQKVLEEAAMVKEIARQG